MPLSKSAFDERSKREEADLKAVSLSDSSPRFEVAAVTYAKMSRPRIKADDEAEKEWSESLAADPWVEEALFIMRDMEKL